MEQQELIDRGYVDGKKSFKFLAEEIHENFDFKKVYDVMKAIDWHWYFGKDKYDKDLMGIPSIDTIKNTAYDLLKQSYDEEKQISTGGFSAWWDNGELGLSFTLEEASA